MTITAQSHYFSESFSKWNINGKSVVAQYSILELEATRIFKVDSYQKIMYENKLSERDVFKIYLRQHIQVLSENNVCKMKDDIRDIASQEGYLNVEIQFHCESEEDIKIINNAMFNLIQGHIHIARVYVDNNLFIEKALFFNDQSLEIKENVNENSFIKSFGSFFNTGMNHILSGYDHLLFILGLLLIVSHFRKLILVITGFTIGHSLTLSLAVFDLIQINSKLVEALIGYTIMFVGLEYFTKKNNNIVSSVIFVILLNLLLLIVSLMLGISLSSALILGVVIFSISYLFFINNYKNENKFIVIITIIFGLIHGLGFGGFLLGSGINDENIVSGLLGFNLGVEFGQIAFILFTLLTFKILSLLKLNKIISLTKNTAFVFIISLGLYFYIQRLMF